MNYIKSFIKQKTPYNLKSEFKFLNKDKSKKELIFDKKIKINDYSYIFRFELNEKNKILGNNIGEYISFKLYKKKKY